MRGYVSICKTMVVVLGILCFVITGCKKKESESPFKNQLPEDNATITISSTEDMAEPMALEQGKESMVAASTTPIESTGVDSSTSTAPAPEAVQTALKNAGYYNGEIDGKIGPKSKEAVLSFQKDNGLTADGKVGPKTWAKLKPHLDQQSSQQN